MLDVLVFSHQFDVTGQLGVPGNDAPATKKSQADAQEGPGAHGGGNAGAGKDAS